MTLGTRMILDDLDDDRAARVRSVRAGIVLTFARYMADGARAADVAAELLRRWVAAFGPDFTRLDAALDSGGTGDLDELATWLAGRDGVVLLDRLARTPDTDAGVVGLLTLANLIDTGPVK